MFTGARARTMDESEIPQQDKSTSFTLGITLLLMAVLVIVAWVLKRSAGEPAAPAGGQTNPAPGGTSVPQHLAGPSPPTIPVGEDGKPMSEYRVLTNCKLEEDPANDGDTFRVATAGGSWLFRLYWVRTVQLNGGTQAETREFMDHFGLQSEDKLQDLAMEARDFTVNTLHSVPFWIVTRWEKDPADSAYLCFVYASDGSETRPSLKNMAYLLVQNGLALVRPCNRPLPEPATTPGDFQNQLTAAETEAKQTRSGGWARQ